MDGNVLQPQLIAVRSKGCIPSVGISFRFYKNAVLAVLTLDQYAVLAEAARIEPHLVAVVEQENLVIHEAGFFELPELLIA